MLQITEVFPNPKGKDGDDEFIELKNTSNKPVNLSSYALDDAENGSKPYKITKNSNRTDTTIQPNQFLIFKKSETHLALNNTTDSARLFDPQGNLIDEVPYTKTTEGLSLSKTKLISNKEVKYIFNWTTPSPGKDTEALYRLDGTISESPQIGPEFFFTITESTSQKPIKIIFAQETITFDTASLTFTKDLAVQLITSKISNSEFSLVDYKIDAKQMNQTMQNQTTKNQSSQNQSSEQSGTTSQLPQVPSSTQNLSKFTIPLLITLLLIPLIIILKLKKSRNKNTMHSCK